MGYESEGEVVGIIGIRKHGKEIEILHLAVHPELRGAGFGRGMILELIQQEQPDIVKAETDEEAVDFTGISDLRLRAGAKSIRVWNGSLAYMRLIRKSNRSLAQVQKRGTAMCALFIFGLRLFFSFSPLDPHLLPSLVSSRHSLTFNPDLRSMKIAIVMVYISRAAVPGVYGR